MNTQLKRLQRISKVIDLNYFYSIEFTDTEIILQGRFNSVLLAQLRMYKLTNYISAGGAIVFVRKNLRIVIL